MQELTISGEVFKVAPRYTEGHVLTDNEASALNQTFFENIRNNMAKAVTEAKDKNDFDLDVMQDKITSYATDYEFGARRGPSQPKDPVGREALKLAKAAISKSLVTKYGKDHGQSAEQVTELAKKLLEGPKGQKYKDQATKIWELTSAAAEEELDGLGVTAAAA